MGCLLLVITMVLLLLETLQEQKMEYFPKLYPLLNAVELYPGKTFILSHKYTSARRSESFISEKGLDI